jgi:hypothetical protein
VGDVTFARESQLNDNRSKKEGVFAHQVLRCEPMSPMTDSSSRAPPMRTRNRIRKHFVVETRS